MANADVYTRWSINGNRAVKKGDGKAWDYKATGGWSWKGDGSNAQGEGLVHAERKAWREAWPQIPAVAKAVTAFDKKDYFFQIKFVVDQQVCPSCQRWMIVEVLGHIKLLRPAKVIAYAEVHTAGDKEWVRIGRETAWPVVVGNKSNWQDLLALPEREQLPGA